MAGKVGIGSMVRVPLGGRRVGGFVMAVEEGDPSGLKLIAALSGRSSVFDAALLDVMGWAAAHYVAPLSVLLARCAPPNNPPGAPVEDDVPPRMTHHPLAEIVGTGSHRTVAWLGTDDTERWVMALGAAATSVDRSLMVVMATGEEVQALSDRVRPAFGGHLATVDHEMDDAAVTTSWARARHQPTVLIGTPRISAWLIHRPMAFAVVEDSRRAMKDRQTPTVHVRDIVVARALHDHLPSVFAGGAPSLELVARGAQVERPAGRIFPLVEVIDRRNDPPGSGLLSDRARQALQSVVRRGGRAFVFAHRRGYSAASRCVRCRTLRRCRSCGSRPDPTPTCRRCGAGLGPCVECGSSRFEPLGAGVGRVVDDVGRFLGAGQVGAHPTDRPVTVGTERDLTSLVDQDLVILVDIDGLMFGADYRAAEEAFRLGVRLATKVGAGTGRRLVVQTHDPDHPVIVALRRADPDEFHRAELSVRESMGYPPFGRLMVVELRGEHPESADPQIQEVAGDATILGPAPSQGGLRWLIQGEDLVAFKSALRPVVQRLRDSGLTVRIDVDPIDL